ncbi:MAG: NAD-dependent epimerase/dehydratase family protein [Deltaproteobacteria bacterium]|nr:MAG: NAD-dependent epimerase/dehydratase family protein [Deltaproteobacteria bacterium]
MGYQCLVTGATGGVGANVVKHLNDRDIVPRVLLRKTSNTLSISDLKWEPCYGDLRDPESLSRAVVGCERVFHSAAYISFWKKRWDEVMRVNVGGTRNLLEISQKAGVKKFVFTSSMAAIGFTNDPKKMIDENSEWNYEPYNLVYHTSKRCSEEMVLGASNDRLHTFALNPGIIFGERDVNLTAARYFKYAKRIYVPFASRGGIMVTDADDLAEAHILVAEKGTPGERYIIASEFLLFKEFFGMVAGIVGQRPPRWVLPGWVTAATGRLGDLIGDLFKIRPTVTYDMAVMGNAYENASCAKARAELGVGTTPVRTSLEKSYRWVKEHNLI